MKNASKLKKALSNVGGKILILFVPRLSSLYIASYQYGIDYEKCEKEIRRLSKKLVKINDRLTGMEVQTDSKELFYEICNKINFLSLKELKVLRAFCKAIDKESGLDFRMHRDIDEIVALVSEYKDTIDECIEAKEIIKRR